MKAYAILGAVCLAGIASVAACGGSDGSKFDLDAGNTNDTSVGDDNPIIIDNDSGVSETGGPCKGLQCQVVSCPNNGSTTITGTVVTPALTNPDPVYNAIVYVPNAPVAPLSTGATCEQCGAPVSGEPIAIAQTSFDGKFTLKNVPVGQNIPLVVQIGKWRRQVVIPNINSCVDNPVASTVTRLPRNKAEGDMPQMAIVSSTFDRTECILKKMGVDDAEFTAETGTGRIHLYTGNGASVSPPGGPGANLWSSLQQLKKYDVVALPCSSYPAGQTANSPLFDYANQGGRLYVTDLSYPVIQAGPAPWPTTANWVGGTGANPAFIDTSFPKGDALANWLQTIGATTTKGSLNLVGKYDRFSGSVKPAQRWVYYNQTDEQLYGFNTPFNQPPANQCGRVFYASFHVASGSGTSFPSECGNAPLTAQEKVLEFMLLDLASCVTDDSKPPPPPPGPN